MLPTGEADLYVEACVPEHVGLELGDVQTPRALSSALI